MNIFKDTYAPEWYSFHLSQLYYTTTVSGISTVSKEIGVCNIWKRIVEIICQTIQDKKYV